MKWQVILFETSRGDKPVESFINQCTPQTVAKIAHHLDLLEKYGSRLGMPHAKKLTSDLYELRLRGKDEIRIIYCYIKNNICLLHAFKKQSQKTPKREIDTAMFRFQRLT